MTIRNLPAIHARADSRASHEITESALARWRPEIRGATQGDDVISILDAIGDDGWGGGVTTSRIAAALRRNAGRAVTVQINSPGGNVFDGIAIYNMLREHNAEVNVEVLALAASAASVIAMAGDTVKMARGSSLMIHRTWSLAIGNAGELREVAGFLDEIDAGMRSIYAARTGIADDELDAMLSAETWLGADEAVARGFADESADGIAVEGDPEALGVTEVKAVRVLDTALARQGMSRRERRSLVAAVKGGTPGAAIQSAELDAGAIAEAERLISAMRT